MDQTDIPAILGQIFGGTPSINPGAGLQAGYDGYYYDPKGNRVSDDIAADTTKYPDDKLYNVSWISRFTPQGQAALAANQRYQTEPYFAQQAREEELANSANTTTALQRRATAMHDYAMQNPGWGTEYLAGTGSLSAPQMRGAAELASDEANGVLPAESIAKRNVAQQITDTTPSGTSATIGQNIARFAKALNDAKEQSLYGGVISNPMYQKNYTETGLNTAEAGNVNSIDALNKAGISRAVSADALKNVDKQTELNQTKLDAEQLATRYKPIGGGYVIDVTNGQRIYDPVLNGNLQAALMGGALNMGGTASQTYTTPDGKKVSIPLTPARMSIWRNESSGGAEPEENTDNTKKVVERPPDQITRPALMSSALSEQEKQEQENNQRSPAIDLAELNKGIPSPSGQGTIYRNASGQLGYRPNMSERIGQVLDALVPGHSLLQNPNTPRFGEVNPEDEALLKRIARSAWYRKQTGQ